MKPLFSDPLCAAYTLAELGRITILRDILVTTGTAGIVTLRWQTLAKNLRLSKKNPTPLRHFLACLFADTLLEDVLWLELDMVQIEGADWFLATAQPTQAPNLAGTGRFVGERLAEKREQDRLRQQKRRSKLRLLGGDVTQNFEKCHAEKHDTERDTERDGHASDLSESDQIRSDGTDSIEKNPSDPSDPSDADVRDTERDTERDTPHLRMEEAQPLPSEFETLAVELRQDAERWSEEELSEALRRMAQSRKTVQHPFAFLRTTLKNLRAEWAQQKIVMLAQTKTLEKQPGEPPPRAGTHPMEESIYRENREKLRNSLSV